MATHLVPCCAHSAPIAGRDVRIILGQHLEPLEGTGFAPAAVAGGTYCRSIPAGRVGGCQTHVMEAAVYGIQEDVFVPMFLMDLSWCETCVIMTPCFNTGGLEALEALGPGLANRSRRGDPLLQQDGRTSRCRERLHSQPAGQAGKVDVPAVAPGRGGPGCSSEETCDTRDPCATDRDAGGCPGRPVGAPRRALEDPQGDRQEGHGDIGYNEKAGVSGSTWRGSAPGSMR